MFTHFRNAFTLIVVTDECFVVVGSDSIIGTSCDFCLFILYPQQRVCLPRNALRTAFRNVDYVQILPCVTVLVLTIFGRWLLPDYLSIIVCKYLIEYDELSIDARGCEHPDACLEVNIVIYQFSLLLTRHGNAWTWSLSNLYPDQLVESARNQSCGVYQA